MRVAPLRGWVVFPRQNRWNQRTVAQFGGIPIFLAFWTATILVSPFRQYAALLISTAILAALGLIDDLRGMGPKPKLLVESLLAGWLVYSGVVHPATSVTAVNQLLTLLWIVGITNAFNLIDNMDGLAGGVAVITLAGAALLAGAGAPVATLALLLMASIAGFWLFNRHPARVFMGDAGALPIGFFLACISVMVASGSRGSAAAVWLPGLLLVVPVFDVLLVTVTRPLRGRAIWDGARDHTSHRLVLLGLSEPWAVALLHGTSLLSVLLAFCWLKLLPWGGAPVALFGIGLVFFWFSLARLVLPETWLSSKAGPVLRLPDFLRRHARFVPVALEFRSGPAMKASAEAPVEGFSMRREVSELADGVKR